MNKLLAHPKTKDDLDAIVAAPRACYMLVGPRYSGKLASALYVADKLNSDQFDRLHIKPNDKGSITIEMAHNLVAELSKKPTRATATRIVIIKSAESMTGAAQNALLKVIEEPPSKTIFLLLVSNVHELLPTIKSRCQTIYIRPVTEGPEIARGRAGLIMEMLTSPEENTTIFNSISFANDILAASPFERILLVDKLVSDKNQAEIIDTIAYKLSKSVRDQNTPSKSLQSMQNYFIYSNAGVNNKHALTEMIIRL